MEDRVEEREELRGEWNGRLGEKRWREEAELGGDGLGTDLAILGRERGGEGNLAPV